MCRVALELKEGQETRCIVFWRKNMPRGILPSLKRKTNYQQPPMYAFLHSNQTNNLTFDCFESMPIGPWSPPHSSCHPQSGRSDWSVTQGNPSHTQSDSWAFPQSHHLGITHATSPESYIHSVAPHPPQCHYIRIFMQCHPS